MLDGIRCPPISNIHQGFIFRAGLNEPYCLPAQVTWKSARTDFDTLECECKGLKERNNYGMNVAPPYVTSARIS